MQSLDETLRALKGQQAAKERFKRLLDRTSAQLAKERAELRDRRERLEKEESDVARLEGLTLTALFHTVLSSKTEQLDKERQEVLRAKLLHDECQAAVESLEAECERLRGELESIGDVDVALEEAITEKEAALLRSGGTRGQRLLEIVQERARMSAEEEQIEEARELGERTTRSLQAVAQSLGSASSWGTWDLIGGGLISTAMKHSHIDQSRTLARAAQQNLRRFESELEDVESTSEIQLELGGFDTFADYFMDGLIFDWIVQSKIRRAGEAVVKVQERVVRARRALDARAKSVTSHLAELDAERRALIDTGS